MSKNNLPALRALTLPAPSIPAPPPLICTRAMVRAWTRFPALLSTRSYTLCAWTSRDHVGQFSPQHSPRKHPRYSFRSPASRGYSALRHLYRLDDYYSDHGHEPPRWRYKFDGDACSYAPDTPFTRPYPPPCSANISRILALTPMAKGPATTSSSPCPIQKAARLSPPARRSTGAQ